MNSLQDYIEIERNRYETEDNNKFAFSFYKITRYYAFLLRIIERYDSLQKQWTENNKKLLNHPDQKIVWGLFDEHFYINELIQLEIESFYIFSKILLDCIAKAIWQYFGLTHTRNVSLKSHDKFVNHFKQYCEELNINNYDQVILKAIKLREEISDVRDWQIEHEHDPERKILTSKMTILHEGELILRVIRNLPNGGKEQVMLGKLSTLLSNVDDYISIVIDLLQKNNTLTSYRLLDQSS